jgi:hypothetical protein
MRELGARRLPTSARHLGTVRGLFRPRGAPVRVATHLESAEFTRGRMVGATGIEPVTPTMSR